MGRVAIALGSNLGDRHAHLAFAVQQLGGILNNLNVSSFIDTVPVDVAEPQPNYLNAVVVGETTLEPRALLEELMAIERARGRTRSGAGASRTLDLDLILYGDQIIKDEDLSVPHPRFRERRFVVEPLMEVAPDWIDPVTGKRVAEFFT